MKYCRFCKNELKTVFVDLNMAPIVNNYIKPENLHREENTYPLITYICENCKLVQTLDFKTSQEIFTEDYAYFSSFSSSWLKHCSNYVDEISKKLNLDTNSQVIELASNDGYLLQYFQKNKVPVLGIEPCKSVADVAIAKNIKTIIDFFTFDLSKKLPKADLIIANNVLAHVPDLNDFVSGIKNVLKADGTATLEFPHILNLINKNQFDTIYHEHYSYISLIFAEKLFKNNELRIYDVEELDTHGGSLRLYICHKNSDKVTSSNVADLLNKEINAELDKIEIYQKYFEQVKKTKREVLKLIIDIKNQGKSIVAYGASAKGNTLFNYCGISTDFIDYSVDMNPHKQNMYLPGSHIYVTSPDEIKKTKPDYIFITPWNIKDEIIEQLSYVREWGCKFIVAIPEPKIL